MPETETSLKIDVLTIQINIIGRPGAGKTTTMKKLLELLKENFKLDRHGELKEGFHIETYMGYIHGQ